MEVMKDESYMVFVNSTPSLIYNNLISKDYILAYIHKKQVHFLDLSTRTYNEHTVTSKIKCETNVNSIAFVMIDNILCIAIASTKLQIFEILNKNEIGSWELPNHEINKPISTIIDLCCKVCCNIIMHNGKQGLVLGTSRGTLYIFDFENEKLEPNHFLDVHRSSITSLTNIKDDQNYLKFSSADESGRILVWEYNNENFNIKYVIQGEGIPCTSMIAHQEHLLIGRLNGKIEIYSLDDGNLSCDILAHSRGLYALDLDPSSNFLVSIALDATINVFKILFNQLKQVDICHSECVKHHIFTGVKFFGDKNEFIVVTTYDEHELNIWKIENTM